MSKTLLVGELENEPGDLSALKKDLAAAATQQNQDDPAGSEKDLTDDVPEKYRGKSIADVIEMHQNAESELGRRGNELGQYKSLTDQLLSLKRTDDLRKGGAEEDEIEEFTIPEVSSTELLDNPAGVIGGIVSDALTHDRQKRQKDADKKAAEDLSADFATKHPDAAEIANSKEFIEWVQNSPSRALSGFNAAQGDLTAGDALLTEWKELQATETANDNVSDDKDESSSTDTDPNIEAARKAATESTGANNSNDKPTGKTYRRLDLIRLKLEDPEAYADPGFQNEIIKAYAEGRVK